MEWAMESKSESHPHWSLRYVASIDRISFALSIAICYRVAGLMGSKSPISGGSGIGDPKSGIDLHSAKRKERLTFVVYDLAGFPLGSD